MRCPVTFCPRARDIDTVYLVLIALGIGFAAGVFATAWVLS
jgi:hypothetical protein